MATLIMRMSIQSTGSCAVLIFLLTIAVKSLISTAICPEFCSCEQGLSGVYIDCNIFNDDIILPPDTVSVIIRSGLREAHIKRKIFTHPRWKNVTRLEVYNSTVGELTASSLLGLENLVHFGWKVGDLTHLHPKALRPLLALESLDLSMNMRLTCKRTEYALEGLSSGTAFQMLNISGIGVWNNEFGCQLDVPLFKPLNESESWAISLVGARTPPRNESLSSS